MALEQKKKKNFTFSLKDLGYLCICTLWYKYLPKCKVIIIIIFFFSFAKGLKCKGCVNIRLSVEEDYIIMMLAKFSGIG